MLSLVKKLLGKIKKKDKVIVFVFIRILHSNFAEKIMDNNADQSDRKGYKSIELITFFIFIYFMNFYVI